MPYSKPAMLCARLLMLFSLTELSVATVAFADQAKQQIHSQAELPRTTYPVTGSLSALLQSDDSAFNAASNQAVDDLDGLFANYDIQDNATLISMLTAKLSLQELKGDVDGGLQTISKLRDLQSKPDLKLTVGLFDEAILKAQQSVPAKQGAKYEQESGIDLSRCGRRVALGCRPGCD
jgi:hypothetical protein